MSNELHIVKRLVDGLSGWLAYQQCAGSRALYSEHFFYHPMHDIAKGLGWRIFAEAQIKHAGAGAPKTIDFVLYRSAGPFKPGVLFIEVKYVAGTNMSALLSRISYDFEKLDKTNVVDLMRSESMGNCGIPKKYIVLAGQKKSMDALLRHSSTKHGAVLSMLSGIASEQRIRGIYRSSLRTAIESTLHWQVVAVSHTECARKLRKRT